MATPLQKAFPKASVLSSTGAATWLLDHFRSNSESAVGIIQTTSKKNPGPYIRFARFTNSGSRIEMISAYTHDICYLAISHVWGDADWRILACLDHEVFISARKKRFIEKKLYHMVGETPFWMDVLAVDQRQEDQVIAIVKHIPKIFIGAERTIAVREGDGLYSCCAKAIQVSHSLDDIASAMLQHVSVRSHDAFALEEMYLKRFWTLEEILVSHTVQFTTCFDSLAELKEHFEHGDEVQRTGVQKTGDSAFDNFYHDETQRFFDALTCLALGFGAVAEAKKNTEVTMYQFLQAYVCCGIVSRTRDAVTGYIADPLSPMLQGVYAYSERQSSKPRDYIFALMAQCMWYRFPDGAKRMTFNEIFLDLDQQAQDAKKGFACRITESMTRDCPVESAWAPSSDQPEPTCLGDFVLLLGNPLDQPPRADVPGPMHLVTLVALTSPPEVDGRGESSDSASGGINDCFEHNAASLGSRSDSSTARSDISVPFLETITAAMEFSPRAWLTSERAGELSKYGSWPDPPVDVRIMPWRKALEDEKEYHVSKALIQEMINEELEVENRWAIDEQYVTEQSMKCLSLMFGSTPMSGKSRRAEGDWRDYVQTRNGKWPIQLRRMMLLMAAMVGCRLPLSAVRWAKQKFSPTLICLGHGNNCLGLLSSRCHGALMSQVSQVSQQRVDVFLVSRGYSNQNRGKDIAILDPVSKIPVGLVPDFSYTGMTSEQWLYRMTLLYGRLCASDCDCGNAHFGFLPLENLDRADWSARVHELLSRKQTSSPLDVWFRRQIKQLYHPQPQET